MKSKSSAAHRFQKFIHAKVPMTKKMGLRVLTCSSRGGVRLSLPLEPNRNHRQIAFGGALVSAQAVAAWAWVWQILRENHIKAEVLLKEQKADFVAPVDGHCKVSAKPASASETQRFLQAIHRHKKARIEVTACVLQRGRIASHYTGEYVALKS